jgi:hypothetical protein
MRMSSHVRERKVSQSAPAKIDSVVRQLFIPMLAMPTPAYTSFVPEDSEEALLRQLAQERPASMESEAAFVECMVQLYRKFQSQMPALACESDPPSCPSRKAVKPEGSGVDGMDTN